MMEFIEGESLLRLHRRPSRPPLEQAVRLMRDVAEELEALHRRGILHRDLKETNVIVSPTTGGLLKARLIDFGLSLDFGDGETLAEARTDHQSELRVGVFGYMPPEVYRCQPYGAGVDTFAFGVLLHKALQASSPLPPSKRLRSWLDALPFQVAGCRYERSVRQAVSAAWPACLAQLVKSCTAQEQKERPTMEQVRRALDGWLDLCGGA